MWIHFTVTPSIHLSIHPSICPSIRPSPSLSNPFQQYKSVGLKISLSYKICNLLELLSSRQHEFSQTALQHQEFNSVAPQRNLFWRVENRSTSMLLEATFASSYKTNRCWGGGGGEGGWMGGWGCFESMERTKEGEGEKKYLRRWKDSQEKDRNLSVMMVMMMMMMMTMMITMMMMVLMVMIVIMMIACPKWESHHRLPGFFCNF